MTGIQNNPSALTSHITISFLIFRTCVPMEESFPSEHSCKLFWDSLEQLLNGSWVTNEGGSHLESSWWNVTNGDFHIIGNPLYKVWRVLVLDVQHLLVHLLHRHSAPEDGGHGQIPSVSGVAGSHHVLGVEHLLG